MENILNKIIKQKRLDLAKTKKIVPFGILKILMKKAPAPLDFKKALKKKTLALIAEVKKASPSKGVICKNFQPIKIAKTYEASGASAISVLTEEKFFQGSLLYLNQIKKAVKIPLLRKDFIVDEYQLYESRAAGADAVLLIVSCLSPLKIKRFLKVVKDLGMQALVEVHNEAEAKIAVKCGAEIIGINNRNLRTFEVDLKTTLKVIKTIPKNKIVVSESGIVSRSDANFVRIAGVDAILVGETLMRAGNIKKAIKSLVV